MTRIALIGLVLAAASGASAQPGTLVGGPYDVQTSTATEHNYGVQYAWGYWWVSAEGHGGILPHLIHQFDLTGAYVDSYQIETLLSLTGPYDGAADESNNRLYFGAEAGQIIELVYEPTTQRIVNEKLHILPTVGAAVGGVIAPLARLGNGNFVTASPSVAGVPGTIVEFDLNDRIDRIKTHSLDWVTGAAWDPVNETVWFHSRPDAFSPGVTQTELDPCRDYRQTGRSFEGEDSSACAAGGLTVYCNGDMLVSAAMQLQDPGGIDSLYVYDLDGSCSCIFSPDCDGDGTLNVLDYLCFLNAFGAGDPSADCNCDGVLDIFDFLCFQNEFMSGC